MLPRCPSGLDYPEISLLKSMVVDKNCKTWLLTASISRLLSYPCKDSHYSGTCIMRPGEAY